MQTRRAKKTARVEPLPILPVIEKVIRGLGFSKRYDGWQVVTKWPEIVGENIAAASKAERYADGILYVKVKSDTWRMEIHMKIDSIMAEIKKLPYGKSIKEIRLA